MRKIEVTAVLFLLASGVISVVAAASPDPAIARELRIGIGYVFLGLVLILVIIWFVIYIFKRKKEEKKEDKVEKVIRMLREMRRIKEEIDRRGEKFLGIGVTIAFGISIISMI